MSEDPRPSSPLRAPSQASLPPVLQPRSHGPDPAAVRSYLLDLQQRIVEGLERLDGQRFMRDDWSRDGSASGGDGSAGGGSGSLSGGGGISRVIEEGGIFERGAVLFSHVHGDRLPGSASAHRPGLGGRPFEAMGVSLVIHPRNPYIPTVHMNVRFLIAAAVTAEMTNGGAPPADATAKAATTEAAAAQSAPAAGEPIWWFGGGMDLTPYYPFEKDAVRFHSTCRQALDPFGADWYPRYKKWCDDYFFLKHRNEARGVGGIFYDDLNEPGFERSFAMTRSVGDAFLEAYAPIVERHRDRAWGERERDFQAWRRGRYVEFNLVYDRGTLFGLQSGGRAESILCSMPPLARWRYDWQAEPGSPEARLQEFLTPRDWA